LRFYLKNYNKNEVKIPNVVGEIKIAVPKQKTRFGITIKKI